MAPKLPLPRGWKHRVRSSVLHILALSHYTFTVLLARAANSKNRQVRLRAQIDRRDNEIALLQEELRIKDARMERVPPHRRPHYVPLERMAILELRASRGWSARQAADRFHVSATTLGSWKARIDEHGPDALLRITVPVNKFPDLVRYIVRRLKLLCPRLGKVKIAEILCRAGLHLAPTTVGRFLRADLRWPEPVAVTVVPGPVVKARRPNELWHVDLSAIPTGLGFWTSWCPHALPQQWPFCWWIVVVLDHYSRRVQGWMVLAHKPDARTLCAFFGRTIRHVGTTPRYLLSDKESMFKSRGYRRWCRRRGIRFRYGAVGKHGSIAIIERFFRTLKNDCTRRVLVSFRRGAVRRELAYFMRWYNGHRPHGPLGVRTPDEVYGGLAPACERPRLELRPRWPRRSRCASPQAPVDAAATRAGPPELVVTFVGGRRHLPIVSLRRAA
jgi:transposase InsO family protein